MLRVVEGLAPHGSCARDSFSSPRQPESNSGESHESCHTVRPQPTWRTVIFTARDFASQNTVADSVLLIFMFTLEMKKSTIMLVQNRFCS